VAVLPFASEDVQIGMADADTIIEWFSGTGAGGQHRNRKKNSVRITHKPTGITVTAQHRRRQQSLDAAMQELEQRVKSLSQYNHHKKESRDRKRLVGSGQRADKIRTYRFQDDQVVDHRTSKTAPAKRVMRGQFDLLW